MKRLVLATVAAGALCAAGSQPARAYGGGGVVLGLAAGTALGVAIAHPFYPYSYGVGYAGIPFYYPPPVYVAPVAVPYPYAYPYPYAQPPGMPQPSSRSTGATPSCPAGQFFNTYTATCDRR